ncbi:MAG: hypothetical protein ABIF71_00195 [Planctomycetota bacterium]
MKWIAGLLVALVVGSGLAPAQEARETGIPREDLFPDTTFIFYNIASIPSLTEKAAALPVSKLVDEFLALNRDFQPGPALDAFFGRIDLDQAGLARFLPGQMGLTGPALAALFPGEAAIGVYLREPRVYTPDNIEWCAIVRLGPVNDDSMLTLGTLFRRVQGALGAIDTAVQEYADYAVTTFSKSGREVLSWAVVNKTFLVITRTRNEMIKTTDRIRERRSEVLGDNAQFRTARRDFRPGADTVFFVDTRTCGAILAAILPPKIGAYAVYLKPLGLLNVHALAGSMVLDAAGVEESMTVYMDKQEGLFALLGEGSLGFDFATVPQRAVTVQYVTFDLLAAGGIVADIVKQYAALIPGAGGWFDQLGAAITEAEIESGIKFRDDIVSNLEGSMVWFTLPVDGPLAAETPYASCLVIKAFEPEVTMQKIVAFINNGLKLKLAEQANGDNMIYYRQFTQPGLPYVSFARVGDKLFIGGAPKELAFVLDAVRQGPPITEDPKFKAFLGDDNVTNFALVDIEKAVNGLAGRFNLKGSLTLAQIMTKIMKVETDALSAGLPFVKFPDLAAVGARLNILGQKIVNRDGNLIYYWRAPVPVQFLLGGLAFSAVRLIPVIEERNEQGRVAQSREKLEGIAFNLELYAMEHNGAYPAALADLYPQYIKTLEVFAAPGGESELVNKEEIPTRGIWILRGGMDLNRLEPKEVVIYQRKDVHADGFWVLLRNGAIELRVPGTYDKLVEEITGNKIEIVE